MSRRQITLKVAGVLLAAFALVTLYMSSSVLFDLFGVREKVGNYVPFVVFANFIASLLYLIAVYGIFTNKRWPGKLLLITAGLLGLCLAWFLFYIRGGGIYEKQTTVALPMRTGITLVFAAIVWFLNREKRPSA